MYKFSTAKRTPSFDDYFKKKSNKKKKVTLEGIDDEIAAMTKTAALNTPKPDTLPTTGSAIKSGIQNVLSKKYGEIDTKHLFDGISDKDIEDNIETAENTIQTNIDRGMLSKNALPKLPNLRDGLALSYAAANKGNSKAATRAREAAYTESTESLVDKVKNGLSYELPKMENAVLKTNEKPKETNLLGDPNTKPESEDFLMKISLSDENKKQNSDNPLLDTDISWKSKALGDSKKVDGAKIPIYSGDTWDNKPQEDLYYADLNKNQLTSLGGVTWLDTEVNNKVHETLFRMLGNLTSNADSKMQYVVNDMINHFFDGTGTDYSNPILTEKVKGHKNTQRYMKDFSAVFHEQLQINNGDITKLYETGDFRQALKDAGVLLSQYDYYNITDKLNGLTMAIHSWTESDVSVESFKIKPDGSYSGTLRFTFKDNFGLDKNDVEKYGKIKGFASWFTLQHYYKNEGKYKPFKTVVEIDYPISGKIEGYEK